MDRVVLSAEDLPAAVAHQDLPAAVARQDLPAAVARQDLTTAVARHDLSAAVARHDLPAAVARQHRYRRKCWPWLAVGGWPLRGLVGCGWLAIKVLVLVG